MRKSIIALCAAIVAVVFIASAAFAGEAKESTIPQTEQIIVANNTQPQADEPPITTVESNAGYDKLEKYIFSHYGLRSAMRQKFGSPQKVKTEKLKDGYVGYLYLSYDTCNYDGFTAEYLYPRKNDPNYKEGADILLSIKVRSNTKIDFGGIRIGTSKKEALRIIGDMKNYITVKKDTIKIGEGIIGSYIKFGLKNDKVSSMEFYYVLP